MYLCIKKSKKKPGRFVLAGKVVSCKLMNLFAKEENKPKPQTGPKEGGGGGGGGGCEPRGGARRGVKTVELGSEGEVQTPS